MAKRRGHGEGTISQRGDGRWQGRVDLGWHDGRRRRKTLYGATRGEVRDKLTRALKSIQEGASFGDERQTLEQFLVRWLEDVARARVRPRTFDTYEAAVTRHIVPHLGKRPLLRLTPQHVQAWLSTLETDGVSVGRRRYGRVVLRAALNTAMRWRLVTINAAALVDAPRTTGTRVFNRSRLIRRGSCSSQPTDKRCKDSSLSRLPAACGSASHWDSSGATSTSRPAL